GGFARVSTRFGACGLKMIVTERQRRSSLFAPIHWSDATPSAARIGDLVMQETHPYSRQPDAKATPAAIPPEPLAFRGFALTRQPLSLPDASWWARVAVAKASGLLLATNDGPKSWQQRAGEWLGKDAELAEYLDEQRGIYRVAAFAEGRLAGC